MTQVSPPAGWYEDPDGALRWWDGQAWTAHTHTAVTASDQATAAAPEQGSVMTAPAPTTTGRHAGPAAPTPVTGTGLYREISPRTTGILMLVAATVILSLRAYGYITGAGSSGFSVGGMLLTGVGFALLAGGLTRLGTAKAPTPTLTPADGSRFEVGATTHLAFSPETTSAPTQTSAPVAADVVAPSPSAAVASPWSTLSAGGPAEAVTGWSTTTTRHRGYAGVGSRGWVLGVLGLVAVLLIGYGYVVSRPTSATTAAPPTAAPSAAAPKAEARWAPKGWTQVPGGLAWKKATTRSQNCDVETACVRISVMAKAACQLVRLEVTFVDSSKQPLDSGVAYAKKLKPKKPQVLRVTSANVDSARYGGVTSLRCMDVA